MRSNKLIKTKELNYGLSNFYNKIKMGFEFINKKELQKIKMIEVQTLMKTK